MVPGCLEHALPFPSLAAVGSFLVMLYQMMLPKRCFSHSHLCQLITPRLRLSQPHLCLEKKKNLKSHDSVLFWACLLCQHWGWWVLHLCTSTTAHHWQQHSRWHLANYCTLYPCSHHFHTLTSVIHCFFHYILIVKCDGLMVVLVSKIVSDAAERHDSTSLMHPRGWPCWCRLVVCPWMSVGMSALIWWAQRVYPIKCDSGH